MVYSDVNTYARKGESILPDYSSDAGFYFEEIKEVLLVMAYGMALTFLMIC